MKKWFITYGDNNFLQCKERIIREAKSTQQFDITLAFGPSDISQELQRSKLLKIKRGGGLWSWKPDIIYSTFQKMEYGDILVYCDAGCSLFKVKEWNLYWNKLKTHDIIGSRIFQKSRKWTRRDLADHFSNNIEEWLDMYQFMATTIIIKKTSFTEKFISEWRHIILCHPEYVMDITDQERQDQYSDFIENRHDQAVYSALIYKYLKTNKKNIYVQWEHMEGNDIIKRQAIRATRIKENQILKSSSIKEKINTLIKQYIIYKIYK